MSGQRCACHDIEVDECPNRCGDAEDDAKLDAAIVAGVEAEARDDAALDAKAKLAVALARAEQAEQSDRESRKLLARQCDLAREAETRADLAESALSALTESALVSAQVAAQAERTAAEAQRRLEEVRGVVRSAVGMADTAECLCALPQCETCDDNMRHHRALSSALAALTPATRAWAEGKAEPAAPAAPGCTGLTAAWCPRCGDCTCPRNDESGDYTDGQHADNCPLHGPRSAHAEPAARGHLSNAIIDTGTAEPMHVERQSAEPAAPALDTDDEKGGGR